MKKIVPGPPSFTLQDAAQCDPLSLDRAAADRALNDYLQGRLPARPISTVMFTIPNSVNLEAALAQASDLLRCAGASASEAGNGLSGVQRDQVLSVTHLVELAKAYVDKSLDGVAMH